MSGPVDVSVIVPAYNAARYIANAIDSVLAQTTPARELIVVDDGSTDATREIVSQYGSRVRYIFQENRGVSAARNLGIESSVSSRVAFLDADDAWLPEKLEKQTAALRESGLRASYTAHLIVDDALEPLFENRGLRRESALEDLLSIGNVIGSPSSVMCDRSLFDEIGGFDPSFSLCADWELWVRVATRTDFANVDEPLVKYRLHGDNMSRDVPLLEADSVRTLEKAFALPSLPPVIGRRRRASMAANYMVLAGSYLRGGHAFGAVRCAAYSLVRDPRQLRELVTYVLRFARGKRGARSVGQNPLVRTGAQ